MTPSPNWRDRFMALAAELCRARGEDPPSQRCDPEQPLQIRLQLDGVAFEVLHMNAIGERSERFELRCRFGSVPYQQEEVALRQALETNLHLGRLQAGIFCLDEKSNELVLSLQQSLRHASGEKLLSELGDMAAMATQWRRIHCPAMV